MSDREYIVHLMEKVNWEELFDARGGEGMGILYPEIIKNLMSDNKKLRRKGRHEMWDVFHHQGDFGSATTKSIPILLKVLELKIGKAQQAIMWMLSTIADSWIEVKEYKDPYEQNPCLFNPDDQLFYKVQETTTRIYDDLMDEAHFQLILEQVPIYKNYLFGKDEKARSGAAELLWSLKNYTSLGKNALQLIHKYSDTLIAKRAEAEAENEAAAQNLKLQLKLWDF